MTEIPENDREVAKHAPEALSEEDRLWLDQALVDYHDMLDWLRDH